MTGKTGKAAASAAGETLGSKTVSKSAKSAAASGLAQVGNTKQTGPAAASAAGNTAEVEDGFEGSEERGSLGSHPAQREAEVDKSAMLSSCKRSKDAILGGALL
jgi:hypothetical protein